jgi:hypothetical protein
MGFGICLKPDLFEQASGIRSGCIKGKKLSGVVAARFEVVFAFLRFEEVGAGFEESDESGDGRPASW